MSPRDEVAHEEEKCYGRDNGKGNSPKPHIERFHGNGYCNSHQDGSPHSG